MNTKYKIISLLSLLWLIVGCEKELAENKPSDFIVANKNALVFPQKGEAKYITITASSALDWRVVSDNLAEWISWEREGNKIKVIAKENTSSGERSSKLDVVMKGGKKTFLLKQFGISPTISVENTSYVFAKEGAKKEINVITNSTKWSFKTLGQATWLKLSKKGDNKLSMDIRPLSREDEGATTNRKATVFLSNEDKHVQLFITQRGFAQFALPFFGLKTRQEILDAEAQRGNTRNDYEKRFYPKDVEIGKKQYMGVNSNGEQAFSVYEFTQDKDWKPTDNARNWVYIKAKENKKFKEEDLNSWLEDEKFKWALDEEVDNFGNSLISNYYYRESTDSTIIADVKNSENARLPHSWDYTGAVIKFVRSSNYVGEIKVTNNYWTGKDENFDVFPTRNSYRINDLSYKLNEVIAYEATQGMIPDYSHRSTTKSSYPGVPYKTLLFKQQASTIETGDLQYIIYFFNYPGHQDNFKQNYDFLNYKPEFAGTVGRRDDFYKGAKLGYKIQNKDFYDPTKGKNYTVKIKMRELTKDKGFSLVREDRDAGMAILLRGEEDFTELYAFDDADILRIGFYKNKDLAAPHVKHLP